jgi:hypothetical protein
MFLKNKKVMAVFEDYVCLKVHWPTTHRLLYYQLTPR